MTPLQSLGLSLTQLEKLHYYSVTGSNQGQRNISEQQNSFSTNTVMSREHQHPAVRLGFVVQPDPWFLQSAHATSW